MTDKLIERINEFWEYATGNLFCAAKARVLADAKIIKAAEELELSLSGDIVYMQHVHEKAEAFRAAMEARG
jgi:predicted nicotinamide N-methyase